MESEERGGSQPSPQGLPTHAASGPASELGEPREQTGGCVLQGSRALTNAAYWLSPGLEARGLNFSPIPSLRPNGSGSLHGMQSEGIGSRSLGGLRNLKTSWALGSLRDDSWEESRALAPGNCELETCLLLRQDLDLRG